MIKPLTMNSYRRELEENETEIVAIVSGMALETPRLQAKDDPPLKSRCHHPVANTHNISCLCLQSVRKVKFMRLVTRQKTHHPSTNLAALEIKRIF